MAMNFRMPAPPDTLARAAAAARTATAMQPLVGAQNAAMFRSAAGALPQGYRANQIANERFFRDFHNSVVSSGRQLQEVVADQRTGARSPQVTTMRIGDYEVDGKTYLVPYYDPALRRVLNRDDPADERRLREQVLRLIQSGRITGYDNPQQAEAHRRLFYQDFAPHMRGGGLIP